MVGPNLTASDVVRPVAPVLDPMGRVYLSGLDGNLWVLDALQGTVLDTSPIGLSGAPHAIQLGVASVLFIERTSPAAVGLYGIDRDAWLANLAFPDSSTPPNVMAGFQIGIVEYGYVDTVSETSRTAVLDPCLNPRWTVPGNYSYPLVISFGDDLIVRDKSPLGNQTYKYGLRRFSRDGALLASSDLGNVAFAILGADDVLYFSDGSSFIGLDRSLSMSFRLPLGDSQYLGGAILNPDGELFFRCADSTGAGICAIQTTSPGPASVSWPREYARDSRSTFWLGP